MIIEILILICIIIGLVFNALGIIGLIRFPDVYTRMHATTKSTTFGSIFLCLGVIIYGIATFFGTSDGQYLMLILHTILAVFALTISNAVGSHAIARAAHRSGQMPTPGVVDRLAEADL
ncbi:MAG TPA: monovalent cation/H(+) antiporter subunit G [Methanospirillum sp.]|nr:monovalent cation/H(+) antiporter subunit G [Methanospirillum sp.]